MTIQNFFDRTYIINLPERTDRRQGIERELKNIGSSLIPGKVELFPAIRPLDPQSFPSKGVLGCYLSHLQILKQARNDGLKNVLIVEDDLAISKRFRSATKTLFNALNELDWGIVFLGYFPYQGLKLSDYYDDENTSYNRFTSPSVVLKTSKYPTQGTHFYVVNKDIYDRLIEFLEELLDRRLKEADLREQSSFGELDGAYLDTAYYLFQKNNPDINALIISPNLGWQRDTHSDITPLSIDDKSLMYPFLNLIKGPKSELKKYLEFLNPNWFSR
jgi:glycosyl transferase family 25